MYNPDSTVIALDIGAARIGVAVAGIGAKIARPLKTLTQSETIMHEIVTLLDSEQAIAVVAGLPRGLDGQETAQTRTVQAFGAALQKHLGRTPLYWQDEAVTSAQAEAELIARRKPYKKGDIDALAATYILEDFLRDNHTLEELSGETS